MEKQFLLYVLYISLVEIRERSYEQGDRRTYGLCDLLHNIPLMLGSDENAKIAFKNLTESVGYLGVESWLETRRTEFYDRYPEYLPDHP